MNLILSLSITICAFQSVIAVHDNDEVSKTSQVYKYRLINWCISGRGEHRLNEWPLNQFKPILLTTHLNELEWDELSQSKLTEYTGAPSASDIWGEYTLEFSKIICDGKTLNGFVDPNEGGDLLQRLHVMLKPKASTNPQPFQGFLIQAVHAPFHMGFPFGVFDTDEEFECSDCTRTHFSRIVGCLSRPDISPMHPTVAMFHYKLLGKDNNTATAGQTGGRPIPDADKIMEYGYQKELHWNFKWANIPCSSARLVEFWALMVLDFERNIWTIKKFGPYNLNDQVEVSSKLDTPKSIPKLKHIVSTVVEPYIIQPGLPTPILPECYSFKKPPLIFEPNPAAENSGRPWICVPESKNYDETKCEEFEKYTRYIALNPSEAAKPELGATFTKYPSAYALKVMPTCEAVTVSLTEDKTKTRVRFVGDFDVQCIRDFPGALYKQIYQKSKRQPYKVCPEWQGKFTCPSTEEELHFDIAIQKKGEDAPRSFPDSHCDPCKPVTDPVTDPPNLDVPFFKRGAHGVMMIYAFFFFNPVSLNIARFYKETLHDRQLKGWRFWLLVHVGFAAMASLVSYIGYTFPSFKVIDAHIGLGYGAMIGISSGIITGWFRHKHETTNTCMLYVHALSGYLGWAFAIASMVFAPGITKETRFVSYLASAFCLAAMGAMTVHICVVDCDMGVRPSRSHIPVIEIRFDDIVPPKSRFRKFFLYGYIAVQFLICFGMLVL